MEKKSMKTSEVMKRAEKLLDHEALARHEQTMQLLAGRIAHLEQRIRERDLGRE